jgi:hypothetical protein
MTYVHVISARRFDILLELDYDNNKLYLKRLLYDDPATPRVGNDPIWLQCAPELISIYPTWRKYILSLFSSSLVPIWLQSGIHPASLHLELASHLARNRLRSSSDLAPIWSQSGLNPALARPSAPENSLRSQSAQNIAGNSETDPRSYVRVHWTPQQITLKYNSGCIRPQPNLISPIGYVNRSREN